MAKYHGTHACGHEGVTNIVGPTKNRQWIADRHFEKLCPECWEKKLIEDRERANAEAAAKAVEMELPELTGTEKQVAWANTLRQQLIEKCEEKFEQAEKSSYPYVKKALEKGRKTLDYILPNRRSYNANCRIPRHK